MRITLREREREREGISERGVCEGFGVVEEDVRRENEVVQLFLFFYCGDGFREHEVSRWEPKETKRNSPARYGRVSSGSRSKSIRSRIEWYTC